jgi:hypothetical protein
MELTIPSGARFMSFTTKRPSSSKLYFEFKFSLEKVKYPYATSWKELECDQFPMGIRTNCRDSNGIPFNEEHRRAKLFVKGVTNMLDYMKKIKTGQITKKRHNAVWSNIQNTLFINKKWTLLNHNKDVEILHFKFGVPKPTR